MSKISNVFKSNHKALIAYITVGYPDIEATLSVTDVLAENGCDIIELGIPFSDPLADGVTIQNASYKALQNGVTLKTCLDVAEKIKIKCDIPLIFMTYFNPIMKYGISRFCNDCTGTGVSGLIIPDLPPEEGNELESFAQGHIDIIYLLAPNSTDNRVNLVAERSRGFIYLVSLTGVTGARSNLSSNLKDFVDRVRKKAQQPLCVGFGISTPQQAKEVASSADGVIIGSKIIQLMEEDRTLKSVGNFIKTIKVAIDTL
jgi:tryptophan synthase alpha chain